MSVLHVAQPTDGGVARYVADVAADQMARGRRVTVACPADGRLPRDVAAAGVAHETWAASREPGPGTVAEARGLAGIVARVRPDVVHLHSAKAGLAGRLAIRGRVPTVFQPHGWSWLAVRGPVAAAAVAWERWAARWTDLVVCVGTGEADLLRRNGITGRHTVVRTGVDCERYAPAGPKRDRPLAVCAGRVSRQKGQDVLLAAWPSVLARCPSAELVVVGPGPVPAPPVDGVRFVGAVDDVRPWYRAADVVVLPSRWEGLPLTALEALACGTSVVGSDIPGIAEIVTDNVGRLVRSGDSAELADAILVRLTDRVRARAEGDAGRMLMRREFEARETFRRLAAVTAAVSVVVRSPDRPVAGGLPTAGV